MIYCSVCRNQIEIIDSFLIKLKERKHYRRKYTHRYCRWRLNQFWRQDFWSVVAFFLFNFLGFLLLILAGTIGKDLILRNTGLVVLGWTILGTTVLFYFNYFAVLRDCHHHFSLANPGGFITPLEVTDISAHPPKVR